jgi:hypothetical protein
MPPKLIETPLRVHEMRIIWRDTFIVENAGPDFLDRSLARLRALPCYVSDCRIDPPSSQPELLRVLDRISRSVAAIGHSNLLRIQFAPIDFANLAPTLSRLRCPPDRVGEEEMRRAAQDADTDSMWIRATPILLLHRAGIGIMQYHVEITSRDGLSPDESVELVRLGIQSLLVTLEDTWRGLLPEGSEDWNPNPAVKLGMNRHLLICGLRDLSQGVIAARLGASFVPASKTRRFLRRADGQVKALPPRPTGSTTVVLVNVSPAPEDFEAYCQEHSAALRGIGAMDSDWRNRARWLIDKEMGDNISTDAEMALFLLGTSELLIFDERIKEAAAYNVRRNRLTDRSMGVTYFYAHYTTMIDWVYLQDAIIRWYLRRLDALVSSATPQRRDVIHTVQSALGDLVQYQEDISPYATRVEFLRRAHEYRGLDVLAERFEKKQERLIEYASEYHDYREARAAEFLNWLAGILTGAALANLIITLAQITPDQTVLYLGITFGSIAVVLGIMAFLLKRI